MRHVKRVAARNLCIPNALIQPLLDASQDVTSKVEILCLFLSISKTYIFSSIHQNLNLDEDYNFTSTTTLVDDIEESQALILKLNIAFYFTIIHPPLSICSHCNDQESSQLSSSPTTNHNHNHQQCNCNRVLYRSELVASAVSASAINFCFAYLVLSINYLSFFIFDFRILPGNHLKVQRSAHPLYLTLLYSCTLYSLTGEKIKYHHKVVTTTTMTRLKSRNYFLLQVNFESTDEPLAQ